jgi:sirohydrochlorin cobaltochelatase
VKDTPFDAVGRDHAALLIIDHGSRRAEAHAHLEALAASLRQRRPGLRVYLGHLEVTPPTIEDAVARCAGAGETDVDVLPLFLAPGLHAVRDLPERVEAAARAHAGMRVRLLPPLGAHPSLADWVLASAGR